LCRDCGLPVTTVTVPIGAGLAEGEGVGAVARTTMARIVAAVNMALLHPAGGC
jgi:hypothetical protein